MSYIYDELIVIAMGALIALASKKCKIYPIPVGTEILGVMLGFSIGWFIQVYFDIFPNSSFPELFRFALLGYLPMKLVRCRMKKDKKKDK